MSDLAWTDPENDLIVADYFAMLADDIAGRPYNKTEHRRALRARLNDRSDGSVEFKHQNISAVLKGLGEDWITGYKPAFNFQVALVDAVVRWLGRNRSWLERAPRAGEVKNLQDAAQIWVGPPPTLSNQPPPQELEQMLSPQGLTWLVETRATGPSDAPGKLWCWSTSDRHCVRLDGTICPVGCAGCPRKTGTARAMIY